MEIVSGYQKLREKKMGMDKEAMDIWAFGRKRPDLSVHEVMAATAARAMAGATGPLDQAAYDAYTTERDKKLEAMIVNFRQPIGDEKLREEIKSQSPSHSHDAGEPERP